jgi:hypothetical protein
VYRPSRLFAIANYGIVKLANQPFEGLIMRKTGLSIVLFGLLTVVSLPTTSAHAQATRTWVSGVGDDANPCSRTAPCKTFAGAISKTAAGGEIDCLDPGGFGAVTITKSMTIDCGPFAGGILATGVNGAVIVNAGVTDKVVLRNLNLQGSIGTLPGVRGIRFLAGLELHLDKVFIQGFNNTGIDVVKSANGFLYMRDSYITETPIGINLTTSAGNIIATIERSQFNGLTGNGVVAGANALAQVSNSVLSNINGIALSSAASGAKLNANNNVIANCGVGASAVAGANLRLASNKFYDNSTGIANAGSFLSDNLNQVAGGTAGAAASGPIPTR